MNPTTVSTGIRTLALLAAGMLLFGIGGCANNPVENEESVSESSRMVAREKTEEALRTDLAMESVQMVQDLTGGFAQGLADEAAGVDMELGNELPELMRMSQRSQVTLGARLAQARDSQKQAASKMLEFETMRAKTGATDPEPGDLLFRFTQTHLDGSVTVISVYQDEPLSVVRLTKETNWPEGNLLLVRMFEEAFIDRGADFASDVDDVWLSYAGELEFTSGAKLQRAIDAQDQGGIVDGSRVDLVSTFIPRPGHPSLRDIETALTVDLHDLEDESDDRFVRVTRVTRLTGVGHDGVEPGVDEEFEPESPIAEGEEPCGGHLSRVIRFRQRSALVLWSDRADWTCAGGGSLGRTIDFADGTHASLTLAEDALGVVTLEHLDREGNETRGRFDKNDGTFEIRTQYSPGADPVSRSIEGESTPDGSRWSLDEEIEYLDGFVETNHLEGEENANGTRLAGVHDGRDGRVEFELSANPDETVLVGHVENDRDEVLDFRLELLPDGSRLLDFEASDRVRRVEGHLEVDADGCGEGTLIIEEDGNRAEIFVTFCHGELDDNEGLPTLPSSN